MKIILIQPDAGVCENVVQWLEERKHVVMEAGPGVASWPQAMAEHEPDLLLVPHPLEDDPELMETLLKFPDCQFRVLGESESGRDASLRAAEDAYVGRRIESRGIRRRAPVHHPRPRLPAVRCLRKTSPSQGRPY